MVADGFAVLFFFSFFFLFSFEELTSLISDGFFFFKILQSVPKVAQCVVFGIYHIFHPPYQDLTIAHGHLRTNHSHSFFTPVSNARNQNTSKTLAHCYTQNTINSKHPSQNSEYLVHITIYNCKRYFQTDSL